MEEKIKTPQFKTSDLSLASFLYCNGVQLIKVDKTEPSHCIFIFDNPPEEILASFQAGIAQVNLLAYNQAFRRIKRELFKGEATN